MGRSGTDLAVAFLCRTAVIIRQPYDKMNPVEFVLMNFIGKEGTLDGACPGNRVPVQLRRIL